MALLIVLTPQWLLYQGEIWKDILFADAAIAGFAALAWQRAGRIRRADPGALLLALAAAIRQNGYAFAGRSRDPGPDGTGTLETGPRLSGGRLCSAAGHRPGSASRSDGGDGAAAEIRLAQSYDMAGPSPATRTVRLCRRRWSDC